MFESFKSWYRGLPDKKRYVEFVTAILSVPVLVTVLIANISSLNRKPEAPITPTPGPTYVIATLPQNEPTNAPATNTASPTLAQCKSTVGPFDLLYPKEGDIVTHDPLAVDISYTVGEYCAAVWSYRIDNGSWSDYSDKSIVIYGLTPGTKRLTLRIKSIVSTDERIIERSFTVAGSTPTPISTSSGSIQY